MVQNSEVIHSAILSPCLWPCGSRVLTCGSQHQMTDCGFHSRGGGASLPLTLTAWRKQVADGTPGASQPPQLWALSYLKLLVASCCCKSRVQGPGKDAGWIHGRENSHCPGRSQPHPISGRGVCTRIDSGLPWVMESHYSFLLSNRIKIKINTFTDICQALN